MLRLKVLKWYAGEAEFYQQRCIRIFGSTQDIDGEKRARLAQQQLAQRNSALAGLTAMTRFSMVI